MHRDGNPAELLALAETMGVEIVDIQYQKGMTTLGHILERADYKTWRMKFRSTRSKATHGTVDLVIIHSNASPRQLVNVHESVQVEVWDRVRLLLSLFISHAGSVEARTQVRIAQLLADRSVLELVNQQTTGESWFWWCRTARDSRCPRDGI